MTATGLGAKAEFILAITVIVGTLNRIPAVASLKHDTHRLAGARISQQNIPLFLGRHVESVEASLLCIFKVVEASPMVALGAERTRCGCVVHVFRRPELGTNANPFVGVAVARVLVGATRCRFTVFVKVFAKGNLLVLLVLGLRSDLAVLMVTGHQTFDVTVSIVIFRFESSIFIVFLDDSFAAVVDISSFALDIAVFVEFLFGTFFLVLDISGLDANLATRIFFSADIFACTKQESCSDYTRKHCNTCEGFCLVHVSIPFFPNHLN